VLKSYIIHYVHITGHIQHLIIFFSGYCSYLFASPKHILADYWKLKLAWELRYIKTTLTYVMDIILSFHDDQGFAFTTKITCDWWTNLFQVGPL